MGIKHKRTEESLIRAWYFQTPVNRKRFAGKTIEEAADKFQESMGYYPDIRNAEPIL
jgi:hypothetical protein